VCEACELEKDVTWAEHSSPQLVALTAAVADALAEDWARLAAHLAARLCKVDGEDEVDAALDDYDWRPLGGALQDESVQEPLRQAYRAGGYDAVASVGLSWDYVNRDAVAYARDRAAEMVGMRRLPDGRLVPNPGARWRISDATRADLRNVVLDLMEQRGLSYQQLKERIEEHPAFSGLFGEFRAEMIARSELAIAQNTGNAETMDHFGVEQVEVLDNPNCPQCAPVAGTIQTLEWAKEHPIQHPNCIRRFRPVVNGRIYGQANAGVRLPAQGGTP